MPSFLKRNQSLAVLIALLLFQMILISFQVPLGSEDSVLEKTLFAVFAPIQHTVVAGFRGIGRFWKGYIHLHGVQKRNDNLERETLRLRQENQLLRGILSRFQSEAELIRLFAEIAESVIPVRIIGLDTGNVYKSIIINKGSLDGIRKNMVVLTRDGFLVGRVSGSVNLKQSRVQLITDNQSGISVSGPKGKPLGILEGHRSREGYCSLNYILTTEEEELKDGDHLITTGYDQIYPAGLKVGYIVSITDTRSLFKEILVKPFLELRMIDRLAVIAVDAQDFY